MDEDGKKKKKTDAVKVQPPVKDTPPAPASRWGEWRIWGNVLFLFLALEMAVYSIEQARWITPQPSLTLVLFLSVLVVWLLTVARLPAWVVHILAVIAGVLVTVWQGVSILPDSATGLHRLFTILSSWLQGSGTLAPAEGKALFGIFLVILTWLVGYLSAWFVLRRNNAWVAVSLGLIVVIVNLSNLPSRTYLFFMLFLLAAALLIIQTRVVRQHYSTGRGANYSGKSLFYLIVSILGITVLAVSVSWLVPQVRLPALQNAIAAGLPWKQGIQDSKLNIFNAVPSKKAISTISRLQTLEFGERWHMGEEVEFTVKSARPAYWQVNVYDSYNSTAWISSPAAELPLEKDGSWRESANATGKEKLKYEVITGINTDALLLCGDFSSSEMPVIVRLGVEDEITAVRSPRVLSPGERYTVRSYASDPSADDLSGAGDNYTEPIQTAYLQLPSNFSEDIRLLSDNITREASNPYEIALAVDEYLAGFSYDQEVDIAPEGVDAVAFFLYTSKSGFCLHFASAMTVMLRSVGVPARLAVGYLPGEPGEEKGEYLLRDKHYHAWTQAYFPGYGWVNFEPTPSGTQSQVSVETPLVSVPEIRRSPIWNIWNSPPGIVPEAPENAPVNLPEIRAVRPGRFKYSHELGLAVLIILCVAGAVGLAFALPRIVGHLFSNRLWKVDRQNLASSVYFNICRLAAMLGLVPEPQQTPLEFYCRLAEVIPEQSKELDYLVRAHLGKRFGPNKGKPELSEEAEILKARFIVYNAILRRAGIMQKLLAKSSGY